jgi:hypothetical protein
VTDHRAAKGQGDGDIGKILFQSVHRQYGKLNVTSETSFLYFAVTSVCRADAGEADNRVLRTSVCERNIPAMYRGDLR